MNNNRLPLLIEPDELRSAANNDNVVIVDLCKPETYAQSHIPGATYLDYKNLVTARPPVMGLIPDAGHLSTVMSQLGVTPDSHIVAYDDEGGGKAARFLYTLDVIGHKHYSLLNGGLPAWANEGHPLESTPNNRPAGHYHTDILGQAVATKEFILSHLNDAAIQIIDARSAGEFDGSKKFAEKAGHIPGAINLDWINLMDRQNNLRLKPDDELNNILHECRIASDLSTVVYCQTHHRSALMYFVLKHLGFKDVKGYPGSWSEWGNSHDTPVECG